MCNFTKGEWEVKRTIVSDFRVKVKDKKGKQGKIIGDIRIKENASLIAAAPEMYAMLENISVSMECFHGIDTDSINNLLAKARGEHV